MATKKECDQYAAELASKFEAFTLWAIANWPKKNFPLLRSDFAASRREIGNILGPKLGEADDEAASATTSSNSAPFIGMKPMPWP
jgi:hypothetical protein